MSAPTKAALVFKKLRSIQGTTLAPLIDLTGWQQQSAMHSPAEMHSAAFSKTAGSSSIPTRWSEPSGRCGLAARTISSPAQTVAADAGQLSRQ